MITSKILAKLRAGKPALLTSVNSGATPLIVEVAARAGYEGIWLDMEHRPMQECNEALKGLGNGGRKSRKSR